MSKGKYDSNDETNEILNCSGKIKTDEKINEMSIDGKLTAPEKFFYMLYKGHPEQKNSAITHLFHYFKDIDTNQPIISLLIDFIPFMTPLERESCCHEISTCLQYIPDDLLTRLLQKIAVEFDKDDVGFIKDWTPVFELAIKLGNWKNTLEQVIPQLVHLNDTIKFKDWIAYFSRYIIEFCKYVPSKELLNEPLRGLLDTISLGSDWAIKRLYCIMIGQIEMDEEMFKAIFERDLIELVQHYDISIKIEALYVTSKYGKYSEELQLKAANEILKLFHKDKDESHEDISIYFPFLIMQVQQSSCQDVWNDISKVFKELITHPNKTIANRVMEHSHHYIRYGLSSKMLDEVSCATMLEWLSKQSKLFYIHLFKIGKLLQEFSMHKLIYPYAIQLFKDRDLTIIEQCMNSLGDLIALTRLSVPKCGIDENMLHELDKAITTNWRLCSLFYEQVPKFAVYYRSIVYFLDSIICKYSNAIYSLKEPMAYCFCKLVIHSPSKSDYIRTFASKYAYSSSCVLRQSYIILIETSTRIVSKKFFMENFYKDFIQLENDKVLNVLFAYCKAIKSLLCKFYGEKVTEELYAILKRISHRKKNKELSRYAEEIIYSSKYEYTPDIAYSTEQDLSRLKTETEEIQIHKENSKDDNDEPKCKPSIGAEKYDKKERSQRKCLFNGPIKTQRTLKSAKNLLPGETKKPSRMGFVEVKKKTSEKKILI